MSTILEDLENHMVLGPPTPEEERFGTVDEYLGLAEAKDYAFACSQWLYSEVPSRVKTVDQAFAWLVDVKWTFTADGEPATDMQIREQLCRVILCAGDMGNSNVEPSDCGEGGYADVACEAILRNKARRY